MTDPSRNKLQRLKDNGTLNLHAQDVTDALFQEHDFFDARDIVQVKYEMLRRVHAEGWPVNRAAETFGFSRPSFYHTFKAFQSEGIEGLVPKKRGPKAPHKLSGEVMGFVHKLLEEQPTLPVAAIAQRIAQRFQSSVHPRSIERALKRQEKKHFPPP